MMRAVAIAAVGTLIPALLLYLWKVSYGITDLAIIWLLFIAALIFLGNRLLVLQRWRAERRLVLREDSFVAPWMTGQLGAFLSSILLVAVLIPALAWHALTMPADVAGILCALSFAAGAMFQALRSFFQRHLVPPFDRVFASGPSTWLIGLPFAFILFYVTWHAPDIPTEIRPASFVDALSIDLHQLPERGSWLSQIFRLASDFDSVKLWIVTQADEYPEVAAFYNLDMVLFGLLTARASIVITNFIDNHYDGKSA
ncbi:hypothetical protein [Paracoccus sp. Ld10]|uniref:hypothetical protein n=1 Tax=Paracoccus sp. Ld10 TaxID=649158 RepID=UPI00386D0FDE